MRQKHHHQHTWHASITVASTTLHTHHAPVVDASVVLDASGRNALPAGGASVANSLHASATRSCRIQWYTTARRSASHTTGLWHSPQSKRRYCVASVRFMICRFSPCDAPWHMAHGARQHHRHDCQPPNRALLFHSHSSSPSHRGYAACTVPVGNCGHSQRGRTPCVRRRLRC